MQKSIWMKGLVIGIIALFVGASFVSALKITPSSSIPTNNGLTLTYKGNQKYYTLEDLLAFDSLTGNGGRSNSLNITSPLNEYTGVPIKTLAQQFPAMPSEYSVVAISSDGYTISYTYNEIQGEVTIYDKDGKKIGNGGVSMILATKENGQIGYDYSYRIAFVNQDNPYTYAALWAKWVIELEFIPKSSDTKPPTISITKPTNALYLFDRKIASYPIPIIIGGITINVDASDTSGISRVLFIISDSNDNDYLKNETSSTPYQWKWDETAKGYYTILITAYDNAGNTNTAKKNILIIHP
jgi:Bacterial Ig domain